MAGPSEQKNNKKERVSEKKQSEGESIEEKQKKERITHSYFALSPRRTMSAKKKGEEEKG
jgi:hypothetical protein